MIGISFNELLQIPQYTNKSVLILKLKCNTGASNVVDSKFFSCMLETLICEVGLDPPRDTFFSSCSLYARLKYSIKKFCESLSYCIISLL